MDLLWFIKPPKPMREPTWRQQILLLEQRVAMLEKIVFGASAAVLLAVLGAIISLVVRSH